MSMDSPNTKEERRLRRLIRSRIIQAYIRGGSQRAKWYKPSIFSTYKFLHHREIKNTTLQPYINKIYRVKQNQFNQEE